MYAKIRPRRSTKTEWSTVNPVLQEGELGVEYPDTGIGTGLCKFKLGDGRTAWNDLPYAFNATEAGAIYGGTPSISHDICLRTGTTDEWLLEDPILKLGEIVFDRTQYGFKCGNGESRFSALSYVGVTWPVDLNYDFGNEDNDDPPE